MLLARRGQEEGSHPFAEFFHGYRKNIVILIFIFAEKVMSSELQGVEAFPIIPLLVTSQQIKI